LKVKRIYEGKAQLLIPDLDYYCKVGSAKYEPSYAPVFYNPEMAFGRSLSILVLRTYQKIFRKKLHICDALAGTGVRGIRYSLEVPGIQRTWLNDKNPLAVELIHEKIPLNKRLNCTSLGKYPDIYRRVVEYQWPSDIGGRHL